MIYFISVKTHTDFFYQFLVGDSYQCKQMKLALNKWQLFIKANIDNKIF